MKWVLIAIAGLILLACLVAAIGAMLPKHHHATRMARYRVSPEALYAVLNGPPDWRTGVQSFGALPDQDGRRRWWEEDTHRQKVTYELVEDRPPARLAVRIADKGLPFGGTWTFDIAPVPGGGSDLRITEDGEIYNVIFRFVAHYFMGYTASIEGFLRDLGVKFQESVSIQA